PYGRWAGGRRPNTFPLKIKKPDELEVLPPLEGALFDDSPQATPVDRDPEAADDSDALDDTVDPEFAMIHTARRVPVYRKLGPFMTKRLREIMFGVIQNLDAGA